MTDPTALPIYVQTAEMLIREIASGRLLDGERLPPERDMAAQMGISVGTLRKALADLSDKGLLDRVQGSGNYVRHRPDAAGVYAFFRLERIAGGGLPTAEILDIAPVDKPAGLPVFGSTGRAHRIRRLRRLSGDPAALEEIWLDSSYAARLRPADLSESLYLYYKSQLGFWITRAEDRIGLGRVPDWGDTGFAMAPGTVCGYVERLSWDQDGRSAEYSRTWFDSDKVRYVSRLK